MWRAGEDYDQEASKVIGWHSEMGSYLKELDSKHLVTSSFADSRTGFKFVAASLY